MDNMDNMDNIKISIIIPIYNNQNYIKHTLDSINNQNLSPIEIICIDNNSSDNSLNILKEYEKKQNNIIILQEKNQGASYARNLGISKARGEYIYFMDGDDFLENGALKKVYYRIKSTNSQICIFKFNRFINNEKIAQIYSFKSIYLKNKKIFSKLNIPKNILQISTSNIWTKIYKKDFILKNHLLFQHIKTCNDIYFNILSLMMADKICYIDEYLINYRTHENNLSANRGSEALNIFKAWKYTIKELKKLNLFNKYKNTIFKIISANLKYETTCIKELFKKELFKKELLDFLPKKYLINLREFLELDIKGYFFDYFLTFKINNKNYLIFNAHKLNFKIKFANYLKTIKGKFKKIKNLFITQTLPKEFISKFDINENVNTNFIPNNFKVSIISCVYNNEKFLDKCLKSIIYQSLKDIQIILVNDGSTDNTLSIMQKYQKLDPRIKIINQKNQGLSKSRNNVLEIAQGEIVVFVDGDDFIRPDALELIYDRMTLDNLDMCSYELINYYIKNQKYTKNSYNSFSFLKPEQKNQNFTFEECKEFLHKLPVSSGGTAYKRIFLQKHKISFKEDILFEDNLFFIQAITKANKIGILNEMLYVRSRHKQSITFNWDKNYKYYILMASYVLNYLKDINIDNNIYTIYKNMYSNVAINKYNNFKIKYRLEYKKAIFDFIYNYYPNYFNEGGGIVKYPCLKNEISLFYIKICKRLSIFKKIYKILK